jgi:hypothetical protein
VQNRKKVWGIKDAELPVYSDVLASTRMSTLKFAKRAAIGDAARRRAFQF